ncbi:prolyl oligopeptidase family serine peptidase [Pendulispora rubella]|uniref:Prolyl oligopeptidase family serine peptidase n=1 Tax=Pendulispora rubella TaxID=2741070 RepID=A0ABZ2LCM6_9BACT
MRFSRLALPFAALGIACGQAEAPPAAVPSSPAVSASAPPVASVSKRPVYPPTEKRASSFQMGGMSFQDDYAWLRNDADPAVGRWIEAQNAFTTARLGEYPHLEALRNRFQELTLRSKPTLFQMIGTTGGVFALRRAPKAPQPAIVLGPQIEKLSDERIVFDPAAFDTTGQTSIDWFAVSLDGKRLAASLSKNGSEDGSLYVFEAATGKRIDGPISRVQYGTGGGSAAFAVDGKSIFYTRYPAPGERPEAELHSHQQLYRHVIGTPIERDERVPLELPVIAEIKLLHPTEDGVIVAKVHIGDGGDRLWYVGQPSVKGYTWTRLAEGSDGIPEMGVARDALYLLSRKGDPRGSIVRIPIRTPRLAEGKVVVPASDRELTGVVATKNQLVVFDIVRAASRARSFDLSGKLRGEVRLPERSTVEPTMPAPNGSLYVEMESYAAPPSIRRLDPGAFELQKTPLFAESPARFDDLDIVDEVAASRDGTKVPITLLMKRGTPRSVSTPLLLNGYGGYGFGYTPNFEARRRVWLDHGGIWAIAHIRGGNDNGESWHIDGKLGRKQNVFDDFIASADHLVSAGYTSRRKLAIRGSSNGGLLMAAVLSQRPDLARATVVGVPFLDMVRFETWPNGLFNTTEFGSMLDPEMAPKLVAYSPYQNTKAAAYPSVFILSGVTDARVPPGDAREFAAKLQTLSTSDSPILLRTWLDAGHGIGTSVFKRAEEDAQVFAFLFRELDITYANRQ